MLSYCANFTNIYIKLANYFFTVFYSNIMQKINNFNYNKQTFKAGLTKQIKNEINSCNTQKISNELLKLNIKSDFKENKVIAWCALQCTKLIMEINNRYGLNLALPNGIFVEDFNLLNVNNRDAFGFMNFAPTFLHSDKKIITPEKTIFFNEFKDMNYKSGNKIWEQADEIADMNFENRSATTDFFLETFLHEFAHVIHEGNMQTKIHNGSNLVNIIISMLKNQNPAFQKLRPKISENICRYATTNQLEMTACDLTKLILDNTSKEKLLPIKNFTNNSPYEKQSFFNNFFNKKDKLDKLLKKTWNGTQNLK